VPTKLGNTSNKSKSYPYTGPPAFQEDEASKFQDNQQIKVVRLSAQRNRPSLPLGDITGTHFFCRLSRPQFHRVEGKMKSIKY
jgi:hypothetical protein